MEIMLLDLPLKQVKDKKELRARKADVHTSHICAVVTRDHRAAKRLFKSDDVLKQNLGM